MLLVHSRWCNMRNRHVMYGHKNNASHILDTKNASMVGSLLGYKSLGNTYNQA